MSGTILPLELGAMTRAVIMWTGEKLTTLQRLRTDDVPMLRCPVELGVSDAAMVRKCRELGIAGRKDRLAMRANAAERDGVTVSTAANLAATG